MTSDEEYDSDDEILLAQMCRQPTAESVLSVASYSNNRPPKWKKVYTILAPDPNDYTTTLKSDNQLKHREYDYRNSENEMVPYMK